MAKKKGGMSAGSLIGSILVVLTAMVLIVNLGLWTPMSKIFGLPEINSLSQLMPGEDSKVKPDVKLGLKEPSLKSSGSNRNALRNDADTKRGQFLKSNTKSLYKRSRRCFKPHHHETGA